MVFPHLEGYMSLASRPGLPDRRPNPADEWPAAQPVTAWRARRYGWIAVASRKLAGAKAARANPQR
jgi:hypothetical protein